MPNVKEFLKKYADYKGTNPIPEDFDEFWDKEVEKVKNYRAEVKITPSEKFSASGVDCLDMYFTSFDGAQIYAKLLVPKNAKGKAPAILNFHGLSARSATWVSYLPYAQEGIVVAAMDVRGQGGLSAGCGAQYGPIGHTQFLHGIFEEPEKLYYHDVYLDLVIFARTVMNLDFVDETRVASWGASQGGGLALAVAALVPEIKLCSAGVPYLSDFKYVYESSSTASGAYEGLSYFFRFLDRTHEREDEFFTKLGYIAVNSLAHRIKAKTVIYSGLLDTTCPPQTHMAVYNSLVCEKKLVVFPDFGHEGSPDAPDMIFSFFREEL